jgi:L-amino acid N-acyltransferase YncA
MIRPATQADAEAIAALWNPWIRDTAITFSAAQKTPADVAAMIAERSAAGHAFLVARDPALLGFATYAQFRAGTGYATCMEHTIILSPATRGRGTGRALMQAVEFHAAQAGAHQMIAGISAENPDGIRFHAAIGYTEIARIPEAGRKFGRYMDLVLMQKFLS